MVTLSLEPGTLSAAGWLAQTSPPPRQGQDASCQRGLLFSSDKKWLRSTGWRKAGGKVGEGWQAQEALIASSSGLCSREKAETNRGLGQLVPSLLWVQQASLSDVFSGRVTWVVCGPISVMRLSG